MLRALWPLVAAAILLMLSAAASTASAAAPGTRTVTVSVVDARFDANPLAASWGRVTSQPAVIDCPAVCSADVAQGGTLVLTVTPQPGYALASWDVFGAASPACGSAPACVVTVPPGDGPDVQIFAALRPQAQLFATPEGAGALTITPAETGREDELCTIGTSASDPATLPVPCSPRYPIGTRVTVTAQPDPAVPGARFVRWSDYRCPTTGLTCSLTIDGDRFLTAIFDPLYLTVRSSLGIPVGLAPPGVACGFALDPVTGEQAPCRQLYPLGTLVSLSREPVPEPPRLFWTGDCTGTATSCVVRMRRNRAVGLEPEGTLAGPPPSGAGQSIRFSYSGAKGGKIVVVGAGARRTCKATCSLGGFRRDERVNVSASGASKVAFKRWSDLKVKKSSRTIFVGDPTAVQAIFEKKKKSRKKK